MQDLILQTANFVKFCGGYFVDLGKNRYKMIIDLYFNF